IQTPAAKASVYICNWSLAEPLCQSQTLAYLKRLAARGYPTCLITFERPAYALGRAEAARMKSDLANHGICWHPLSHHPRTGLLVALFDGVRALLTGALAVVRHRPRIVHTRTS